MKKNALIKGTLILTAAGLSSRIIGFFYRIFLSRMFGEEGMGIYELMNPVLSLTFALCTSGIQSAVSKFTAGQSGPSRTADRLRILLSGMLFSGILSAGCAALIYRCSEFIAGSLLLEPRCAPLLRIAALSFPAACLHSCINGYYYGIRKAGIPALCQLVEQCFRVGSVFLFWEYAQIHDVVFSINVAAVGLVIGEFASTLVSLPMAWFHFTGQMPFRAPATARYPAVVGLLLMFAAPLSANRVFLHLLGAVESARLPASLQQFGYSQAQALSVYGVFTGMAMTCIHFPGALTNSVSVLLMPLVAEADANGDLSAIRTAVLKCVRYCLLLGFSCLILFFVSGNFLGSFLFHSELTGRFLRTLSFLCPFLYLNTTLLSVLNGLGRTGATFALNMLSLMTRLSFVFFAVPCFGIQGYLWGMLAGQLLVASASCLILRSFLKSSPQKRP